VRVAERAARVLISIGGIGTIAAITLIFAFLVWVVAPLFTGAEHELRASATVDAGTATSVAPPAGRVLAVDEYQRLALELRSDASVIVSRLDDGATIETRTLFDGARLTSTSLREGAGDMAFGFADGTVRLGRLGFASSFVGREDEPAAVATLAPGASIAHANALYERLSDGRLRAQTMVADVQPPVDIGLGAPVTALDRSAHGDTTTIAAIDASGKLVVSTVERVENLMTGEVTLETNNHVVPVRTRGDVPPTHLLLTGASDVVLLVWDDGTLQRYDVRDPEKPALAEELDLVEGEGRVTALAFLIGKTTLITGDSVGRVRGWFGTKPEQAGTVDGVRFQRTHELSSGGSPVVSLATSSRGRIASAGFADGSLRMYHVTSHKLLFETKLPVAASVDGLVISPKEDGLVAWSGARTIAWHMDLRHPEATLGALFRPVWYEGYAGPEHVWQSTSGTDDFEPKLGLWPLVFGTLKATFYSMLFGAPLALLAAIFTSEFLDKRLKGTLKSLTEMMASLPSVVLGFLAAIVVAPFVQGVVPTILASFFTVPFALLLGAYAWQLLPQNLYIRWSGVPRFAAICACLPIGLLLAMLLGPLVERVFFAGDVMAWLSQGKGSSVGGWLLLLLPLSALAYAIFSGRVLGPWVRRISASWDRDKAARFDLLKFAAGILAVIVLALVAAVALDAVGFDPRGGVLDTYVQRNALIVGFVMGFAIVPIVYTLAEDALSSIPAHLRLASLGAGATPWQTAVRVVVPTAMSGLFSALMIGLGRAVGETMIVLMATGNTPVTSWNVFNGFRTLSANIAVEMPEAVRNSTHYRTLFLAAFCLFALTFVLNTLAEFVRQRFRKRAYQL